MGLTHEDLCNKIAQEVGADSVKYNTIDNLVTAIDLPENELCLGCLTCKYVHEIPSETKGEKKC